MSRGKEHGEDVSESDEPAPIIDSEGKKHSEDKPTGRPITKGKQKRNA